MKVKTMFFLLMIFFSFSILVNGETTTTGLISDSDTLPSGYFVSYTRTISHSSTTIRVAVTSSGVVDVAICGGGEFEDWNDGGSEPYWDSYRTDITSTTITLTLSVGSYDFVIMNLGYSSISYSISATQTYEVVGGNGVDSDLELDDWIYGLIGFGIIALVIGTIVYTVIRRRRRRQMLPTLSNYQQQSYQPHKTYQVYQPKQTYQPYQSVEQPPTAYEQTPKGLQVCNNCGNKEEIMSRFCTLCGSKLS